MSNIAFLFLPLAFSSLPAVLPFVSPSSQVVQEWPGQAAVQLFCWRLGSRNAFETEAKLTQLMPEVQKAGKEKAPHATGLFGLSLKPLASTRSTFGMSWSHRNGDKQVRIIAVSVAFELSTF